MERVNRLVIDLSAHNASADFDKIKAAGVEGVIIRLGYRGYSTGKIVYDAKAAEFIGKCIAAGIPYGLYFFDQAITYQEGVEQANWVLEQIKLLNTKPEYPIYIDSERSHSYTDPGDAGRADNLSVAERTAALLGFVETIKQAGYLTGVYASTSWFANNIKQSEFSSYERWEANYIDGVDLSNIEGMWQYSSSEGISGVSSQTVDKNHCYIDYPTKVREEGYNGYGEVDTSAATQFFKFPMEYLRVTQGEYGTYSHAGSMAMDFGGKDTTSDKLYCPCDMLVKRTRAAANGEMYLESIDPVKFADGTIDYARLLCIHDSSMNYAAGDTIPQGTYFYDEGGMGSGNPNKFGIHVHMEAGKGKWKSTTQSANSSGTYVIENQDHLYSLFVVGDDVQILDDGGYNWKRQSEMTSTTVVEKSDLCMKAGPVSGGDKVSIAKLIPSSASYIDIDNTLYIAKLTESRFNAILNKCLELTNIPCTAFSGKIALTTSAVSGGDAKSILNLIADFGDGYIMTDNMISVTTTLEHAIAIQDKCNALGNITCSFMEITETISEEAAAEIIDHVDDTPIEEEIVEPEQEVIELKPEEEVVETPATEVVESSNFILKFIKWLMSLFK